jgi:hypothetical protein
MPAIGLVDPLLLRIADLEDALAGVLIFVEGGYDAFHIPLEEVAERLDKAKQVLYGSGDRDGGVEHGH